MAGPEYDKSDSRLALIESKLRSYPDFPKKGILFYDLFSVLGDAEGLADVVSVIKGRNCGLSLDKNILGRHWLE